MFYEKIVKIFNKNGIKYAIVGGVAVNLHGVIRMTADLDIIVSMDDENLKKLITIMKEEGFTCKIPVDPIGIADKETRKDWIKNKNMKALNFYRIPEEVDIIVDSPVSFNNAHIIVFSIRDIEYPILSRESLIEMKQGSMRPKDIQDVEQLKNIIELEKNSN